MQLEVTLDMKQKYLERRQIELKVLRPAHSHNLMDIQRFAHQIKGNGITFGFAKVSEIGVRLEQEAKSENVTAVNDSLNELHTLIEALVVELSQ